MANYIPLSLPTMDANANFASAANFLAKAAKAIVDSGNSYIQGLNDLKDSDFFSVGGIPEFFSPVFYSGTIEAEALRQPTRPAGMTPPNISSLVSRLNSLTLPTPPSSDFTYTDPGYASAMRDPLIAKLLTDLLNGGYGIDDNDEARLWNRARDREAKAMLANIEEVKRQYASTSFSIPQGSMFKAIEKAREAYIDKVSSLNRDIALKRADLYVENRRRVIEQVLATESQSIALYNAVQGRALEIARTEVALAVQLFEAGVRYFMAQIDGITKQIDAQMDFAKANALVYNSDIAMYSAYVNALVANGRNYIATQSNILERDKAKLFASVDQVKFRLGQLQLSVENSKDINKYGADFFRTDLGASMNGINGLAVQTTEV